MEKNKKVEKSVQELNKATKITSELPLHTYNKRFNNLMQTLINEMEEIKKSNTINEMRKKIDEVIQCFKYSQEF